MVVGIYGTVPPSPHFIVKTEEKTGSLAQDNQVRKQGENSWMIQ